VLEMAVGTPLNHPPTKLRLLIRIMKINDRQRDTGIALRVFAFREASPVQIRIRSSSRPIQTGTLCGEPSGMRVARWAKFGASTKALISLESTIGMQVSPCD